MTLLHYFIFLGCLLAFNVAVLYSYFLRCEMKEFEQIHNRTFTPALPKAYPILIFSFLAGAAALFYFTPDKTWFFESKFLYFSGLAVIFAVLGFIPADKKTGKTVKALLELAGIAGFVFITPDNSGLFSKIDLPPQAVRAGAALIWFVLFKFLLVLNQFEGLIAAQAFHIGFSSLLLLVLTSFSFISLLQINGMLCVLVFMLTPFYYILPYELPLKKASANILSFFVTGLSFLMIMTGNWGAGILIMAYVLFELIIVIYRFIGNLFSRQKASLFFFETLQERGIFSEKILGLIIRYNFLMSGFAFFSVYLSIQVQAVLLAVLFYIKLYFNIMDPGQKASLTDLYKQAKKDIRKGLTGTGRTITELKEKYQAKTNNKEENKPDEQP
ncbi:MAG: hypothetical protein IJY17_08495 [Alphaproteobacteria bacterium]|nr:hypothetical protein [Alphaproteobacteria bacterium]